jgi:MFS family permease
MRHPATRELATPGTVPGASSGSRRANQWGALAAICLATFVVLTDFMAVGIALPAVQTGLNASFPELQWVMEAFVVALTCGVLAASYAAGRAGRRPVFLAGLAALVFGSFLAALAPSVYVLISARAVQGIGGAMLLATGAAILAELFGHSNGRTRPSVGAAVWGTATAFAVVIAPVLGSVIVTYLGWRWVFGVAGVASCVAFLLLSSARGPQMNEVRDRGGLDWQGLALFTAGTTVLVIGLVRTTTTLGGWAQSGVLACLACSVLLLGAFVAVESVSPSPVLDVSLFRRRTFAGGAIAAFGLSAAVLGPFIFLVLYLSYNLGYSTLNIGTHLLVLTGMTLALLPLAGWLDRYVPVKLPICTGLALVGFGLWLMSRLPTHASWADLLPGFVVAGAGLELVNPRLDRVATASAGPQERSVLAAARASTVLRQLGTAIGVAVLGSVFATRLTDEISSRVSTFPQLSGQGPEVAGIVLDGRTSAAIRSAPALVRPALHSVVQTSFTQAMHQVFLVAAGVAIVSAVLALSIKSSDVRNQAEVLEGVAIVPALAALTAGEKPRAELVPGPSVPTELQPAELGPSTVTPAEALVVDVAPKEVVTVDLATIDLASRPSPPAAPVGAELATVPVGGTPNQETTPTDVTLTRGRAGDVLELAGLGSLAVKVTRSKDGSPLKAELALLRSATDIVLRHWTDGDGELIVPDLPAGHYEVVVQSIGYQPETMPVAVTESGTRSVNVGLVGVGHIYGAVSGPGGGWLPGVLITLADGSGAVVATTTSDDAGSFRFTRVPEGSYTVAAPAWAGADAQVETGPGSVVAADVEFAASREENDGTMRPLEGGD